MTRKGKEEPEKRPRGRPKGSKNKSRGRVVAIGVDVPTISEEMGGNEGSGARVGAGRPTAYKPEYALVAKALCKRGASDADLAEEFGVKTQTIWNWRCKHQEFFDALNEGKDAFDDRAERALALKAIGYSFSSEKVFSYEGTIVRADVVEHVPPDVGALKMWLGNRRPDKWKDKQEVKLDGSEAFLRLWQAISDGASTS